MANNFDNDGSFLENFMKVQREKEEAAPRPVPKPKLPPVRKPVLMRVSRVKKAPVLVKPAATAAALEGTDPPLVKRAATTVGASSADNEPKMSRESRKGEISKTKQQIPDAQLLWVCEFPIIRT